MPQRHLPVRPNVNRLKHQAKDLLQSLRSGDSDALDDWKAHHPRPFAADQIKLADAQLVLARSYESPSWPRLMLACRLAEAIWSDDLDEVRGLLKQHPELRDESVLIRDSNWGPPMSYAANLGRDRIIELLHALGAKDHLRALDRATLQSQILTARRLHAMAGAPRPTDDTLGTPAYTLSAPGTALMLELGARVVDERSNRIAPVDVVLETDSRKPAAKHRILEMYVEHGLMLPDTPVMALHRGRIDLLELHLQRDPNLVRRTFSFEEIYPPELGCHDPVMATHGTPLAGTTLLHMCVDYDEMEIAEWLLRNGADVNTPATIDRDGFGGHSALFATVVSQPNFWMNHNSLPQRAPFTELFLAHGAEPNLRVSLRKQLHPGYGAEPLREYRDVTPLSWGQRFCRSVFVSEAAMQCITAAGGKP